MTIATVTDFLKHPLWLGTATGWWILLGLGLVVEWALGRSKNVQANSIAAAIANGLRLLLVRVGLLRLPIVGPIIVHALEVFSGIDLDGDGKVGAIERASAIARNAEAVEGLPVGTVTKDPPVLPVLLLVASLSLFSSSCALLQPAAGHVVVCAGSAAAPLVADVWSALASKDWDRLGSLAKEFGFDLVACTVNKAGADARTAVAASADPRVVGKARGVSDAAETWLRDNQVTFK